METDQPKPRNRKPVNVLPRYCDGIKSFASVYKLPVEMMQYYKAQGSPGFDRARVHCVPFLEAAAPVLKKLYADNGKLLKQVLENAPPDLASLKNSIAMQELEEKQRLNLEARKLIHTKTEVLEMVEEPLQPIFNTLKNFEKDFRQEARTLMAGVDEQIINQVVNAAAKKVNKSLEEFREQQGLDKHEQ